MRYDITQWINDLTIPGRPDEYEVRMLLQASGLHIPPCKVIEPDSPWDMDGIDTPYTLKICSPDILHKTEVKGVRLNLTPDTISEAVADFRTRFPGKRILAGHQVPISGNEFIIGAVKDPVFGPTIMTGAGGIFTEIYRDVSFRLIPCAIRDAEAMLDELKISPVLNGFRGMEMNKAELAETIHKVSGLVDQLGDRFVQMDINPIVFSVNQWVVLDAVLELKL